jgi:hypothetical protein
MRAAARKAASAQAEREFLRNELVPVVCGRDSVRSRRKLDVPETDAQFEERMGWSPKEVPDVF